MEMSGTTRVDKNGGEEAAQTSAGDAPAVGAGMEQHSPVESSADDASSIPKGGGGNWAVVPPENGEEEGEGDAAARRGDLEACKRKDVSFVREAFLMLALGDGGVLDVYVSSGELEVMRFLIF